MARHIRAAGVIVATLGLFGVAACSSSNKPSAAQAAATTTTTATTPAAGASDPGIGLQNDFVNVVKKVRPSVVEITTSSGLGSGVIYDAKGDIVTNNHVVGDATQFTVTFFDGQSLGATLVGTFPPDDLAVIKVADRTKAYAPATFADSSTLHVGDLAMAIGNPLGLASSVTEGIVGSTDRTVGEGNGVVLPDTVQTSAAINPGNSGGALVSIEGAVIGIPTLAATDPELGGSAAPGIGFAIASNTVKLIAGQLVDTGKVTNSGRAALGIGAATATDMSGQPAGVIVTQVTPGGAADRAGIKVGDVITQINGQPVTSIDALQTFLAGLQPGVVVKVTVVHADGTQQTVSVTLQELTG